MSRTVFPKNFLLADPFWFPKITTDPYILAYVKIQGYPRETDIFKINSTQLFSSKFTFIYAKLKLKTCHTRWLSFKNDICKMTTIFLDAVFKPFFFLTRPWHGPTTDDRSDEFPDGWIPSNHSTYGVFECKHAISNTPKRKKSHVERSGERGGHCTSPKRVMRCPGNMFRTMVIGAFAVCAVAPSCWNHTLTPCPPPLGLPTEYYQLKDVGFPWVTL